MDYYRKYVGDYARDTARLSMIEHGAYNLLLDHYYAEERALPRDIDEVCRIVRAMKPDEKKAVSIVLTTFFRMAEDGWHHKRVDEEIAKAQQARSNGRRGGRTSQAVDDLLISGSGSGTDNRTGTDPYQPPASSLQTPTASRSGFALPAWLEPQAWQDYEEHRRRLRKPMTDRARQLAIKTLDDFRKLGQEPRAVIDQSLIKGWTGLFEVKAAGRQSGVEQHNDEAARAWLAGGGRST